MKRYKHLIIAGGGLAALALLLVILFSLLPPKEPVPAPVILNREDKLVGICLPDESDAWLTSGKQLLNRLTEVGYQVKLCYADGTAQTQNTLLLELMAQGADCLVVAPVDSAVMKEASEAALEKKVPILSYGSLLMDTAAVAGYICYDYQGMGEEIGRYVVQKLRLDSAERDDKIYTVELFMGSPEDYNAVLLHQGIMRVLTPYLEAGVLECKSRRTAFEDCCIQDWSDTEAERVTGNRLKNYLGVAPDVCICASDSIASGVIRGLESKALTGFVTGNGATEEGIANLKAGKLGLTVRTDPGSPARLCGDMVDLALFGAVPAFTLGEVNNNVVAVPTALCEFTLVDE
jgi:putative multiple sugar transport system substrate-binding protein